MNLAHANINSLASNLAMGESMVSFSTHRKRLQLKPYYKLEIAMIDPKGISEQLLFSTVRVEVDLGAETSVGTGFFFGYKINEEIEITVIITNKHVLEGGNTARFKVHLAADQEQKPSGTSHWVVLGNLKNQWTPHPDQNIDLCAVPIGALSKLVQEQTGKKVYYIKLDETLIPNDDELAALQAVENVLMIGYPTGLWDEENNLPLVRRGITATHPAIDYKKKSITVIDAACFPGSSGSPVLLVDEGGYASKGGFVLSSRVKLLGVLFSGPSFSAKGEIVIENIPVAQKVSALTNVMVHLGHIIKSKELVPMGDFLRRIANP
jgi:V8-like Glu-specific endopeptidase